MDYSVKDTALQNGIQYRRLCKALRVPGPVPGNGKSIEQPEFCQGNYSYLTLYFSLLVIFRLPEPST